MTAATFLSPALATSSGPQPTAAAWRFERKLDGLRCIAVKNGTTVELWSRNRLPFTGRFPAVVEAVAGLDVDDVVLDGELVAFTSAGAASFGQLQSGVADVRLMVFDVVHLLGHDLRSLPLEERLTLLQKIVPGADAHDGERLQRVEELTGDPEDLMATACSQGWEGLVAKERGAAYPSGRSPSWRKLKCMASQELVIGGWTDPKGSRTGLGALLVGYYQDGALRYAGKVGTGFSAATLRELEGRLQVIEEPTSPFVDPIKERSAHWTNPELVAAITFAEWTSDGRLRHPSFQGLRSDKAAVDVVREVAQLSPRQGR